MNFYVMTLFPGMVMNALSCSITGRAMEKGLINVKAVNIRDYTVEKHGKVDDYPFGGGYGMLMQVQPIDDCFRAVCQMIARDGEDRSDGRDGLDGESADGGKDLRDEANDYDSADVETVRPTVLYMSPQGERFSQKMAESLSLLNDIVFLCGHYEGIDERALEITGAKEVSLGDYVLTGGEFPAMVMIDCISRLIPGVLKEGSAMEESFHDGLLEYPQYSRPEDYKGLKVPKLLLSGHHENVKNWRRRQCLIQTAKKRPDLLKDAALSPEERIFVESLMRQSLTNLY